MNAQKVQNAEMPVWTNIKPVLLKEVVDEYVIGNEKTKKILSTAIYNHYKRLSYHSQNGQSGVEIEKSNILLIGGTGSGKTYLVKTICKLLNVPYYIGDASTMTASGYVGADAQSILTGLYMAAGEDLAKAQHGICIIDEIDKIANKEQNATVQRDVNGQDVQYELLKMMEGTVMKIQPKEKSYHEGKTFINFDTTNVLFICMGAFEGIEKIIEKRLNIRKIGFRDVDEKKKYDANKVFSYVNQDDIRAMGLIRELIGRLHIIVSTDILSKETLKDILTKPKNSIVKQYQELFKMDGWTLEFEDDALDEIAGYSIKNKSGARSLRTTIEKILQDDMFETPLSLDRERHLTITAEMVREKLEIDD